MNLNQTVGKGSFQGGKLFLGGVLAVFFALLFAGLTRDPIVATRPVTVEEKEILIATIDRVFEHAPGLVTAAANWRDKLAKSSLSIFVDNSSANHESLWMSEGVLWVNVGFFETDSVTQESTLMQLLETHPTAEGNKEILKQKS